MRVRKGVNFAKVNFGFGLYVKKVFRIGTWSQDRGRLPKDSCLLMSSWDVHVKGIWDLQIKRLLVIISFSANKT